MLGQRSARAAPRRLRTTCWQPRRRRFASTSIEAIWTRRWIDGVVGDARDRRLSCSDGVRGSQSRLAKTDEGRTWRHDTRVQYAAKEVLVRVEMNMCDGRRQWARHGRAKEIDG